MSDFRYVTLPDGSTARVHGHMTPIELQTIKDAIPPVCGADTGRPMPPIAQRIHGRTNYVCGLQPGHEGSHVWPARSAS